MPALSKRQLECFVDGYIECALWCGVTNNDGESVSDGGLELTIRARATLASEAKAFARANAADLIASTLDMARAGHDFWLTRNRHGAGYWDEKSRGDVADKALDRLTDAAHTRGDQELVLGRGGKVSIL